LEADKALSISSLVTRFEQEGNGQVKAVCDEDTPAFTAAQWKAFSTNEHAAITLALPIDLPS